MKRGSITEVKGMSMDFIQNREHHAANRSWTPHMASTAFLSKRMDMAGDLYKKDLFAHFGCVNAIEFSTEGNFLISGGDDRRVLLWNLETSLSGSQMPKQMKGEHSSNIFCLSFDAPNSKIFSAGNDEQVIVHEIETGKTINVFMHEEAVYGVCVNPFIDSIFASAGEDGQILLYDIRAPASADPLLLAKNYDAFYSVQFHPLEPMFVVTANSKEGVGLWDVRKPRVPVVRYGGAPQSSMCAKFNRSGSQIVALRRRLPPFLFNTHSSSPVCEFDAEHYYNSCTMKSCCFAGARDQFILSGSDDFNLYMWRIPDCDNVHLVPSAHLVLQGHRSIVNQVRFNPQNSLIASSGVEKIVKLWSSVPLPGSCGGLSNISTNMSRKVYTHEEYIGLVLESEQNVNHDYSHGCTEEDPRMMAFFDSLVQREVEGFTTNTDISDNCEYSNTSTADTETSSQSSTESSHSDNSDSDTSGAKSKKSIDAPSKDSSSAPLPIRKRRPWDTASSSESPPKEPLLKRRKGRTAAPANPEAPKSTRPGSEWILRLIAKKRAMLKAAKKAKRKQRQDLHKGQKRLAKRSFLKCYSSSRRYLYQPDRLQNQGFTERISEHMSKSARRRRQAVAPYTTVMLLNNNQDSDENNEDRRDLPSSSTATTSNYSNTRVIINPPPTTSGAGHCLPVCKKPKRRRLARLWSSNSSSSSDEKDPMAPSSRRPPFLKLSDSDTDMSKDNSFLDLNNIVSEIIDSDNNSEGEHLNSVSKELPLCNNLTAQSGNLGAVAHSILSNGGLAEESNGVIEANLDSNDSQIPIDLENLASVCIGGAVPISSISTDEAGSVMFELERENLHLNNVNIFLAHPTTPQVLDETSNDNSSHSIDKSYSESPNADTPDSGISMTTTPSGVSPPPEKKRKMNSNGIAGHNDAENDDSDSTNNRLDFSLKKHILKSRLKNYRPRIEDV